MKAIDRPFTKIIDGCVQFVIPVFQRDYGWTEAQCEQLWSDVIRVGNAGGDARHFIGSVVYVASDETSASFTRWLIIDGQQRVTTLTLLMTALRDHIEETKWQAEDDDGPKPRRIDAYFLRNPHEDGDRVNKLVLRRHDDTMLQALLDRSDRPKMSYSRVLENYEFFRDKMTTADPAVVHAGVSRLVVVDVTLDRANDDPQMVFESLNSTGLDLTQADLIRNYILMRVPEKEQTRLYQTYWRKIEELFRDAGGTFDAFARDYMALHQRASKQARGAEIYQEFREFFRTREAEVGLEEALVDMLRFAGYHAAFSMGRGADDGLRLPLQRLSRLASVAAILVMRLNDCHHRLKTLSQKEFVEALSLLESYVFRRSVCGMQTRGYWKTFATFAYRIEDDTPLLSLKVALKRQRGRYRFANDDEFMRELAARDVYNMRTCHYLLDRLENHGSKEPTDTSRYTVEHVMPQNENLPVPWRLMLGESWQEVHQTWIHRLGNLTLTGYNSEYQDRPFEEKKTIAGGFNQSSVRLNEYVRNQDVWTSREMEERGDSLAKRAATIWSGLDVAEEAVKAAERADLKARASKRSIDQVPMSAHAKKMFEAIRERILGLDAEIIEMAEPRSVTYHSADFFVEVLPRKYNVTLLLDLDFEECDSIDDRAGDASTYKFFVNATQTGGVYYTLDSVAQVDGAMHLVRQAYEAASG
jgi:uncharacterized protein with ParB-like and HNH nuclease domain/predicted transport protein